MGCGASRQNGHTIVSGAMTQTDLNHAQESYLPFISFFVLGVGCGVRGEGRGDEREAPTQCLLEGRRSFFLMNAVNICHSDDACFSSSFSLSSPLKRPESSFFSFVPDVDPNGWMLNVLGSEMSPTDVLAKPSPTKSIGDGVFGGSPHLRGT